MVDYSIMEYMKLPVQLTSDRILAMRRCFRLGSLMNSFEGLRTLCVLIVISSC